MKCNLLAKHCGMVRGMHQLPMLVPVVPLVITGPTAVPLLLLLACRWLMLATVLISAALHYSDDGDLPMCTAPSRVGVNLTHTHTHTHIHSPQSLSFCGCERQHRERERGCNPQ